MTPKERNRHHGIKIWIAAFKDLRSHSEFENFWTQLDLEVKKGIREEILNTLDNQIESIRLEERHSVCLLIAAIRQSYTKQMLSIYDDTVHSERLKGYREVEEIVNEYRESCQKRIKK